jgi:V8-like Glu-specific endopeptidase
VTPPAAASAPAGTSRAAGGKLPVNASPTVGKVFFRNPQDGRDYVCSASALNSNSRKLVITAGHCIHGGRGGTWMQNWVFVPLYNYGSRPRGTFAAKYFTTFAGWVNDSNFDRDVAFVTMWENERGQRVVDAVGGNGLAWNYPREQYMTIFGYPAAPPYDGGWQQVCTGTTVNGGGYTIALRCGFTGGSSGGPWFREYNDSSGLGSTNGAMSTIDTGGMNRSSYFDTAVRDLFAGVADRT